MKKGLPKKGYKTAEDLRNERKEKKKSKAAAAAAAETPADPALCKFCLRDGAERKKAEFKTSADYEKHLEDKHPNR